MSSLRVNEVNAAIQDLEKLLDCHVAALLAMTYQKMEFKMKKFTVILLMMFLLNCTGSSLVGESDTSISAAEDIVTLILQSIHHSTPDEHGEYPEYTMDDGTRMFENNLGVMVTLTHAVFHWGHFDLISDGDDEDCEAGHDVSFDLHTLENFLDEDLHTLTLYTESALENRAYCQYTIHLTADNSDTHGIEDLPEAEGASIYVAGTWSDGADSGSFEIKVTDDFSKTLSFKVKEDGVSSEHPLHYDDDETEDSVLFGNKYDQWFNDMDFSETAEELAEQLVTNIDSAMHQHLGAHHGSSDDDSDEDEDHDDEEEDEDHDH
jgi:hypothetical protein